MFAHLPSYVTHKLAPTPSKIALIVPVRRDQALALRLLTAHQALGLGLAVIVVESAPAGGSLNSSVLRALGASAHLTTTAESLPIAGLVRLGLAYALYGRYEGVVVAEPEARLNPAALRHFAHGLDLGYDYVHGTRFAAGGAAFNMPHAQRVMTQQLGVRLLRFASGFPFTDADSGLHAISSRLLGHPSLDLVGTKPVADRPMAYIATAAARLGMSICELPVVARLPRAGRLVRDRSIAVASLPLVLTAFQASLQARRHCRRSSRAGDDVRP